MSTRESPLCPRCVVAFSDRSRDAGLSCGACAGVFVFRAALEATLREAAAIDGASSYRSAPVQLPTRPSGAFEETFQYLRCPVCERTMNRKNFLRKSGVIVDECLAHGVWFDAGEVQRAGAFLAAFGAPGREGLSRRSADLRGSSVFLLDLFGRE